MTLKYEWLAGSTSKSVTLRIIDSTDGTPETGVVFNTSGIDLQYRREGAASVAITEATLAALTTAWSSGGFLHIGNGYYRLDVPDAALAAGSEGVLIHGTVTGMVVIGAYVQLVAYNPFDAVRLGLTALPNAVPGAAGGMFIAGTNAATTVTTALTTTFTGNLTGSVGSVTGAVGSVTGAVGSVTGSVGSVASGGITSTSIATGAIDADALATDAITEIADGVWNSTRAGHTTAGTFGEGVASVQGNVTGSVASVTGAVGSVTGNVGGNVVGSVGSVTGAVASVTGAVGSVTGNVSGNVTGSVGSLAAQAKADVNAEVLDVLVTDTFSEPGQGAPGVNVSMKDKIGYLYKAFRNKITQTSTTLSIFADDTTTVDHKSTVSDDSTTYTRSEISSGP